MIVVIKQWGGEMFSKDPKLSLPHQDIWTLKHCVAPNKVPDPTGL